LDFLNFFNLQYLTTEFGLAKNCKAEVEKAFFFIFIPSCPERNFLGQKSEKITEEDQQKCFFKNMTKSVILTLIYFCN
jgi:hypothetical protein